MVELVKMSEEQKEAVNTKMQKMLAQMQECNGLQSTNSDQVKQYLKTILTGTANEGMMSTMHAQNVERLTEEYRQHGQEPAAAAASQPKVQCSPPLATPGSPAASGPQRK